MRNTLLQDCRTLAPMLGTIQPEYEDDRIANKKELHQACDRTDQDEKAQNWVGGVSDETGEYGD